VPVDEVYRTLREALNGDVRSDEPMRKHTTFRIGGPAAYFVTCDTLSDLTISIRLLDEACIEWIVLGRGSNVLVSDSGWPGAVIVLGRDFRKHTVEDEHLQAGAGAVLGALVQEAYSRGLSGLEFAVGIPGTLGGALAMNAGSRERWIGSVVESVSLFVPGEGLCAIRGPEIVWGYRHSGLTERGIIVEAVLRVQQTDSDSIRYSMDGSLRRRKLSQPIGAASAGSVFVNPEGDSAGRLIEAAGLKGARVGGAVVSAMHANFIVNEGSATASDVIALVRRVMGTIEETYGIELKPEISFLGTFEES
jgi:UDP-N-acetylmuramate dehydrogenase